MIEIQVKAVTNDNGVFCGFVYFRGRKFPDRELRACDAFTKDEFNAHLLPKGQGLFRLLNDNSKTEPVVLIDTLRNKLHFMRDYDVMNSGWDRGHAIDKLIVYGDSLQFHEQFDSVANILSRD
jgi:hypothetical protein